MDLDVVWSQVGPRMYRMDGDANCPTDNFWVDTGWPIVTTGKSVVLLCKNAGSNQAVNWGGERGRAKEGCVRWGPVCPWLRDSFGGFCCLLFTMRFSCRFIVEKCI